MPITKNAEITLSTPNDAYIRGRNGSAKIKSIQILSDSSSVDIDAIGNRGLAINGGMHNIPLQDMDALATAWLENRGFTVGKPESKKPIEHCKRCGEPITTLLKRCTNLDCPYNAHPQSWNP